VIDRTGWPFGAFGRSAALASRLGWRGFWWRQWGFLTWLGIRVALAIGPIVFLWQAGLVAPGYLGDWPVLAVWGLAGTISCASLACFDAVLLVDTRIRTEGLDIALRRAPDPARAMVHTRPPKAELRPQPSLPPWPQALVRPSAPAGLSRQARAEWMQAQDKAHYQESPDPGREP
jgi:hypothetical protein